MNDIYHVKPENDLKPHSLSAALPCECKPRNEKQPNGDTLIIHNAWDGREFYEQWFTKEGSDLWLNPQP